MTYVLTPLEYETIEDKWNFLKVIFGNERDSIYEQFGTDPKTESVINLETEEIENDLKEFDLKELTDNDIDQFLLEPDKEKDITLLIDNWKGSQHRLPFHFDVFGS